MEDLGFGTELKMFGILGKIIKFVLFSKVGKFFIFLFILFYVSGFIGREVNNFYNAHIADSTELIPVKRPVKQQPLAFLEKHKKQQNNTDTTLVKQSIRMRSKNGEIIGAVVLGICLLMGIVLYFFVRSLLNQKGKNNETGEVKGFKNYNNAVSFIIPTTNKREKIILANPFRGVFIQGGAGSGKSESLIIPFIKQCADKNYCGIIYDFKNPELIKYALHFYNGSNINIKVIDFKKPGNSARINPLNVNNSVNKIVDLAQALFFNLSPESIKNKDFFVSEAINLFIGVMLYFKNNQPHIFTIPHVVSSLIYCDIKKVVGLAVEDVEARAYLSSIHQAIESKADPQLAGVVSTLVGKLATLCNAENFYILSGSDVDLNLNNPDNPTMLLIGNDSTAPEVFNPLISCIITACVRNMNEENKHHSIIMLDEAPTIYIPKIEQIPGNSKKQ